VREVVFVAGETSGDMHASRVAEEIRRRAPDLGLAGIGGTRMERAGVELLEHSDRLAVMGFGDAIRQAPRHYRLLGDLRRRFRSGTVKLVILVDYPGFNLKVAQAARDAGVPVLYYITPQVWAWGAGRLARMVRTVTKAAVILPFEEPLLRARGIDTTFVGHPLLDAASDLPSREEARRALGIDPATPLLALFPGSRQSEVARHMAPFAATARELQRRRPGLEVVVSAAPGIALDGDIGPLRAVSAPSFALFRAADATLCKSGTSTLEAAVACCPMIIAYRTRGWEYAIGKLVVRIPYVGLVNVIAGARVAPEFLQDDVQPIPMADALEPLLDPNSPQRAEQLAQLASVRAKLGTVGASARVASLALEMIA
jgi:lipid-A-disaccharide synthase